MDFPLPTIFNEAPTNASMKALGIYEYRKIALRVSVNIYIRCRLAEAQNWRCCWCGVDCVEEPGHPHSATIEHLQPRSLGGVNHKIDEDPYENYAMACSHCNNRRGTLSIEDFMAGRIPEPAPSKKSRQERRRDKQIAGYVKKALRYNEEGWFCKDGTELCKMEWFNSLRIARAEKRQLVLDAIFGVDAAA